MPPPSFVKGCFRGKKEKYREEKETMDLAGSALSCVDCYDCWTAATF